MEPNAIQNAADLCEQSYNEIVNLKPGWKQLGKDRFVNLYRLKHQIRAFVITETEAPGCAYVVFRGTIPTMAGNWFFANFQLFKTKYQDCSLVGTVHMGFYRAFHWLWRGEKEPEIADSHTRCRWKVFAMRHAIFALLFLVVVTALNQIVYKKAAETPILSGWQYFVIPWVTLILFEVGVLEWLFKRWKPIRTGDPLRSFATDLSCFREVIFTGHSLGGAMATLAFADYQKNSNNQNGRLITFASPRIGDADCMKAFEANPDHQGRYLNVINLGDPVPLSPGTLEQARRLPKEAGWLRAVMVGVGHLRRIWAFLYEQQPPGEWSKSDSLMEVGEFPLSFQNHKMPKYKSLVDAIAPLSSESKPPT